MKCAAACSQDVNPAEAVVAAAREVRDQLHQASPDLTVLFVSHEHRASFPVIAAQVQDALPSRILIGATAETVIAGQREVESGPALAIWSATLPGSELRPFSIEFESTPDGVVSTGIPEDLADDVERLRAILLLAEPFSSAPQAVLERFADDFPGVPVIGGMASGAGSPGENRLFYNHGAQASGAVGVALLDGPTVSTVVSQGCRPVGEPFVVTRAERNVVLELGGLPALQRVQEVYQAAQDADRRLLERGLHLGLAMSEYRDTFGRGDFLVANVLGADRNSGAIAVGHSLRAGQTVQFHVRDAASADEDFRSLLQASAKADLGRIAGCLLFSCNGRGTRMFPQPDHDATAIQEVIGPVPLAGMFANGEIGPVGAQNYIHGFTASLAIFRDSK